MLCGIIEGGWKEPGFYMKKKILPVMIIIALIIIIGLIFAAQLLFERFSYSGEQADLASYYGLSGSEDAAILYNDELLETKARSSNGTIYLDIDSLHELVSGRFYYGIADGVLLYTTPSVTYTTVVGESTWSSGSGESGDAGFPISYLDGETLYVSLDYASRFSNVFYRSYSDPNRVQIISGSFEGTLATLKKDMEIRVLGGRKSEVVSEIGEGSVLVTNQMDEWSEVVTWNGHIGYVENKYLDVTDENITIDKSVWESVNSGNSLFEPITDGTAQLPAPADIDAYTSMTFEGKLNIGFQSIGGVAGNETVSGAVEQAKALNVLAPTWFALSDNEGHIQSFATNDYVTYAHANNIQVWAAVDDFNAMTDFDTEEVLSHTASRTTLVNSIMEQVATYGIDGINVDFENVQERYIQSYLQFLRELSVVCRANQIYLSIDNYVPMDFNSYYNLEEQGVIADYIIVMGYDEHYTGSEEAGSVASIDYVEKGITNALNEVPAQKLVNAIPFYTRLWSTSGGELSCKALHMDGANTVISDLGIELNWDEKTCQYYGEVTAEDGTFYQIWNEDARSIEVKLGVMQAAGIAGVAEWALGFETADVWDVISAYVAQ